MRNLRDAAIELGFVELPAGRTRSRYARIVAPSPDSSGAEARVSWLFFVAMWFFMVTGAVASASAPSRLMFVVAACFTTLVLAHSGDLRRSSRQRVGE